MDMKTSILVDLIGAGAFAMAAMLSIVFGRPQGASAFAVLCLAFVALAFMLSFAHTVAGVAGVNATPVMGVLLGCVALAACFGATAVVMVLL